MSLQLKAEQATHERVYAVRFHVCIQYTERLKKQQLSVRSQNSSCPWWGLVNEWNGACSMCCFLL